MICFPLLGFGSSKDSVCRRFGIYHPYFFPRFYVYVFDTICYAVYVPFCTPRGDPGMGAPD